MSYVISGNYRDRNSKYRWLIRNSDEPIGKARACKRLIAQKVRFSGSQEEIGFGCSVVAIAEEAHAEEFEPRHANLSFNGADFIDEDGQKISEVETLELHEDGKISATIE